MPLPLPACSCCIQYAMAKNLDDGTVFVLSSKTKDMNFFFRSCLLQATPDIPLQSAFHTSSYQAEEISSITNYFFIAAGFILLSVAVLTAYVLFRFREKKQHTQTKTISQKWEIVMIGVPTLLVAVFLYMNINVLNKLHPSPEGKEPDVVITGHQWWWEARYPAGNVIAANEIHLPAGKKLLLKLQSADVIHDWWVPALGNKMDMVPTQDNYLWVTIKSPGVYHGICSEFCGAQHAHMRIRVIAEEEEAYKRWLQEHQRPAISNAAHMHGEQLFIKMTCGNCHRINGTGAQGNAAPDLTHIGSRSTLLAGLLDNNLHNLESFIKHPQKVKPGVEMPDMLLDDTTVSTLAQYLYSLK